MNHTEKARQLALERRTAKPGQQGTEGHKTGGQFKAAEGEHGVAVPRLEQLRRLKRNGRALTPQDSVELHNLELAERAKVFEAAERCQRKDGTTYGTRGKCVKGTPVDSTEGQGRAPKRFADGDAGKVAKRGQRAATRAKAEKLLADVKPVLPSSVKKLEDLASGKRKLPADKKKREELYRAAHARLGKVGNNPANPTQQNDGYGPEREALKGVIRLLSPEFNSWNRLTEGDIRRAVGTVD